MRASIALVACLALSSCLSAPAWEPIGGFQCLERGQASGWDELTSDAFVTRLERAHARASALHDYTATLETHERIVDDLFPRRVMRLKAGHRPFRVAIETLAPENEKGQRVWYDESWNDGEILAETPGLLGRLVGRVSLDPEGDLALKNRRHPITDIGLLRLVEQVEERFRPRLERRPFPRLRAATLELEGKPLTLVEASVPLEDGDPARMQRFGFDEETGLLVYYGQAELLPDGPALIEEYLYTELGLDPGLALADFRPGD